jgi:hypothetical protein
MLLGTLELLFPFLQLKGQPLCGELAEEAAEIRTQATRQLCGQGYACNLNRGDAAAFRRSRYSMKRRAP